MLQIKNLVTFVVFFAMVQSQPSKEVPYLRSYARDLPLTFPCDSLEAKRAEDSGNLFHCNAALCTVRTFVCDSIIDCPNFADENAENCRSRWNVYCAIITKPNNRKPFNAAFCDNGMCITECDVCDGRFFDCSDASDELFCTVSQRPDPERCEQYDTGLPEGF